MADYREVLHERLFVRVPGGDKLRKTAAARLKHLLATGWREVERKQHPEHIWVRFERTGHAPMQARLPKRAPEVQIERRPRRDGGRTGGYRRGR
jgi:hypothetical protein